MGKVISLINMTPDGFADAQFAIADADFFEFTHQLLADTQTVAFGRKTFEIFQNVWPARLADEQTPPWQRKMASAMAEIPKVVYSSSLTTTTWNNSSILPNIELSEIDHYKKKEEKGLLTLGSLNLVERMTAMNLIDDYYFCMQPLIAGGGDVRLFDKLKLDKGLSLQYIKSIPLKSGVNIIHYQPKW